MTKPKKALKMSDEEIMRRRENGESIQDLADKNGVCQSTMQRVLKALETKKRRTAFNGHCRRRRRKLLRRN